MRRPLAVLLAVTALALAGCGGGGATPTEPAAAGATIEHRYGSTPVPADPQRVVTLGLTDHDTVLALGVVPVALTDWYGDQPGGVWPWAQDLLGDAQPVVLDGAASELQYEAIAAADPDLILAGYSSLTQEQYDTLSAIAPTVAQSADYVDFGTPWQDQTRTFGTSLGRAERAEELVTELETEFAAAREANPEFAGRTGVIGITSDDGSVYVYGAEDSRARFLGDLGFEQSADVAGLIGAGEFSAQVSAERFGLLAGDAVVWLAPTPTVQSALETNPAYQAQPWVQQGRAFFPDYDTLGGALSYNSVLSLPIAIEGLVPQLQAALDGDPATTAATD